MWRGTFVCRRVSRRNEKYAVLVIATPGSSVKGQIGAVYGEKMAERGFVTLAFDPSYQGQSGGEPRDLEDPAARVEDIRLCRRFPHHPIVCR